jgi:hydroxymethylpyrimidine kinase/phosphomethylpyrimidine kinase
MSAFGVHGCSVITALTAQNTLGVKSTESVSESMLKNQLQALSSDLPPSAIKTGMLGSAGSCKIVTDFLAQYETQNTGSAPFLVCDPVLKSTSGSDLLDPAALDILITELFPKVGILTPNLPEAEALIGKTLPTLEDAAKRILDLGVGSVLIKGGHENGENCMDFWSDGSQSFRLSSPRIDTRHSHGTGCVLSSAIASAIALDQDIPEAIIKAKTFMNQCLKSPSNIGKGHGPMLIGPFKDREEDRPTIHQSTL